jgi:hypothetical protein
MRIYLKENILLEEKHYSSILNYKQNFSVIYEFSEQVCKEKYDS